jgi:small subunit ribosomal protein S2
MKELLEAGVHFGHQTKRWNPKMKPFIFGQRNGIYIIDLQKTLHRFQDALDFVSDLAGRGGRFLFVGTKRQAQETIQEEARRCSMYFVTQRWLGGTLTNYRTIRKSIQRLRKVEELLGDEVHKQGLTKKEIARLEKERLRLDKSLQGIKGLDSLPDALFIIDPKKERIAILEAQKLGIPVVAVVDTNCDPDGIDFPIPGNDDAIRAIRLFASRVADAVLNGINLYQTQQAEGAAATEAYAPEAGDGRDTAPLTPVTEDVAEEAEAKVDRPVRSRVAVAPKRTNRPAGARKKPSLSAGKDKVAVK